MALGRRLPNAQPRHDPGGWRRGRRYPQREVGRHRRRPREAHRPREDPRQTVRLTRVQGDLGEDPFSPCQTCLAPFKAGVQQIDTSPSAGT